MADNCSLTDRIEKYLCERHEVKYTGKFQYTVDDTSYSLLWNLNNQDKPMVIAGDFESEEDFYNYVCKEIDTRKFFLRQYFILKHTDKDGRL